MTPIKEAIINKKTTNKPIWLMRQAGRYLPEFRKIRKLNPNFINLCLNDNLSSEITLQLLKRFNNMCKKNNSHYSYCLLLKLNSYIFII